MGTHEYPWIPQYPWVPAQQIPTRVQGGHRYQFIQRGGDGYHSIRTHWYTLTSISDVGSVISWWFKWVTTKFLCTLQIRRRFVFTGASDFFVILCMIVLLDRRIMTWFMKQGIGCIVMVYRYIRNVRFFVELISVKGRLSKIDDYTINKVKLNYAHVFVIIKRI